MRTLAIDFGERRIGLAISDENGRMALPLETLVRESDREAIRSIRRVVEREGVQELLVGEPRNLDGSIGPAAQRARHFALRLATALGLPYELADESLTSVEARERLLAAGGDLRRDAARLDALAAQVLLEEVLERRARTERGRTGVERS